MYLSNNFTAVRAGTSTSRGNFSGREKRNKHIGPDDICYVVLAVFWGILLRPTAGAVVWIHKLINLQMCAIIQEQSWAIFVLVFHRDICRKHSLIGRRNCLMTEAANSISAAAGSELSNSRNPIANLASD